jgi:hypothetical protein
MVTGRVVNTYDSPAWGRTQLYVFSTYRFQPSVPRPSPAIFCWHVAVGLLVMITCIVIGSDNEMNGLSIAGVFFAAMMSFVGWLHYRHPRAARALGWASAAYFTYRGLTHDDDHHAAGGDS